MNDISRKLSKLLRHTAIKRNINIDYGGWVEIDQILKKCSEFKMS